MDFICSLAVLCERLKLLQLRPLHGLAVVLAAAQWAEQRSVMRVSVVMVPSLTSSFIYTSVHGGPCAITWAINAMTCFKQVLGGRHACSSCQQPAGTSTRTGPLGWTALVQLGFYVCERARRNWPLWNCRSQGILLFLGLEDPPRTPVLFLWWSLGRAFPPGRSVTHGFNAVRSSFWIPQVV